MSLQDQLQELYALDRQIRSLRSRVDATTRRRDAQATKLQQFERQSAEVADRLKHARADAAAQENDAAAVSSRIDKVRGTMTTVRSNKEYSALLVEVNTLKLDQAKHEEAALEHMGKIEELDAKAGEVDAKLDEQRKLVEHSEKELGEASAEISGQLGELEKERDAAAEPIDAGTLVLYRKLAADYEGEALAEVEEQDRKRMEYTCGACYMALPIQVVNATLSAKDKPVVCPNCDRILYVKKELKEGLQPK